MTAAHKKPPAAGGSRGLTKDLHPNDTEAQRQRLDNALRRQNVSTIFARRDLDILCPAARVFELRARGWKIDTVWIESATDCGRRHRVGLYVLRSAPPDDHTGDGPAGGT